MDPDLSIYCFEIYMFEEKKNNRKRRPVYTSFEYIYMYTYARKERKETINKEIHNRKKEVGKIYSREKKKKQILCFITE